MVDIKSALRGAEGKTSLDGIKIDAGLKATLERLMPIYQKHWWPEHERVNRAWSAAVQPLLERHGTALSQALTRTYDTTWPSNPVPVDLSVTAGPTGAYTTGPPTHVTISSSDPSYQGLAALEMLFHESSHSPVSDLFQRVRQAAGEQKVSVPPRYGTACCSTLPASSQRANSKRMASRTPSTPTSAVNKSVRRRLPRDDH